MRVDQNSVSTDKLEYRKYLKFLKSYGYLLSSAIIFSSKNMLEW